MVEKRRTKEEQIQNIIKYLNVNKEQAEEVYECDKKIDKGERVYFDLTEKEEREAMQWVVVQDKVSTKSKEEDKRGKNRPPNELKEEIIKILSEILPNHSSNLFENVKIINKNRQISFKSGEKSFELTLVQKRK